jgi:hypothetical protein
MFAAKVQGIFRSWESLVRKLGTFSPVGEMSARKARQAFPKTEKLAGNENHAVLKRGKRIIFRNR